MKRPIQGAIGMTTFLICWALINVAFVGWRVWVAYVIDHSDEAQWQRLHPGMPLSRRPQ